MQFYERILYGVEELVHDIRVDLEEPFQGKAGIEFPASASVCNSSIYKETEYYFNGRCFSFHLPSCILSKGILEMKLFFIKKVKFAFTLIVKRPIKLSSPSQLTCSSTTPASTSPRTPGPGWTSVPGGTRRSPSTMK